MNNDIINSFRSQSKEGVGNAVDRSKVVVLDFVVFDFTHI